MKILKIFVMFSIINLIIVFGVIAVSPNVPLVLNIEESLETDDVKKDFSANSNDSNKPILPEKVSEEKTQTDTTPRCLIKIYDVIYDLAKFRSIHSGGDIFQCNTDMTKIFTSQHSKSYLSSLEKYRVK